MQPSSKTLGVWMKAAATRSTVRPKSSNAVSKKLKAGAMASILAKSIAKEDAMSVSVSPGGRTLASASQSTFVTPMKASTSIKSFTKSVRSTSAKAPVTKTSNVKNFEAENT